MGACYEVNLKIQFKDKDSESKCMIVLQDFIRESSKGVNYSLEKFAKEGVTPDSFTDILKIFLGGWIYNHPVIKRKKKWLYYRNGFDASYSWESVMMEMFDRISPYLVDGSELYIYPDNDYDHLIVKNGRYKMLH